MHRYRLRIGPLSPARLTVLFCLVYTVLSMAIFKKAMDGKPLVAGRSAIGETAVKQ
jgi:hypothetical protein